jgi:hypothetical protein
LRPNSYRRGRSTKQYHPRRFAKSPAEPPVATPGNRLRLSQRAFSGTHAQFRCWADIGSKQAEAWIFGVFALDDQGVQHGLWRCAS